MQFNNSFEIALKGAGCAQKQHGNTDTKLARNGALQQHAWAFICGIQHAARENCYSQNISSVNGQGNIRRSGGLFATMYRPAFAWSNSRDQQCCLQSHAKHAQQCHAALSSCYGAPSGHVKAFHHALSAGRYRHIPSALPALLSYTTSTSAATHSQCVIASNTG